MGDSKRRISERSEPEDDYSPQFIMAERKPPISEKSEPEDNSKCIGENQVYTDSDNGGIKHRNSGDDKQGSTVTSPLLGAGAVVKGALPPEETNPIDKLYKDNEALFPTVVRDSGGEEIHITYEGDDQQEERGNWGGKIEFILTCIGFAVGLGNVWRFPYLCYRNGGGAFLIPFLLMLAFVGFPLFFLEFAVGQFASLGPISVWNISPLFKGVGFAMVIVSYILSLYYNVVISHCMYYLFASLTSVLPWTYCNNTWNNNRTCYDGVNRSYFDNGTVFGFSVNLTNSVAPSEEYYEKHVLEMSAGIDDMGLPRWKLVLCLLLCWAIVLGALLKGIQSLGKSAYFTAIFPYIMLTILLVRGALLPGSLNGVIYYLKPDWSKLLDAKVWTDAATQIFFALSCCNGGLIAMSSYNKFKNNFLRDALIVVLLNIATSIYAGFVIFTNLGFMAHVKNTTVDKVAKGGPGLAFVVYPEALTKLPVAPLWSVFFFIMMVTLGFGSQFSIVETVLSGLQDEFRRYGYLTTKWGKIAFRSGVCFMSFLLGIPMTCRGGMYLLNLLDWTISGFPLLVIGLVEVIVICYLYGVGQLKKDIELMIKRRPNWYWRANWLVITPLIITSLLVFNFVKGDKLSLADYVYPAWAVSLSYMIGCFPLLFIPGLFLWRYCRDGGWTLLLEYKKPVQEWGPADRNHRAEFISSIRSNESLRKSKITSHNNNNLISVDGSISGGGTMNMATLMPNSIEDGGSSFFQSKLSVASKLSAAATKEANRIRTRTNSFTGTPANALISQDAIAALAANQQQSELARIAASTPSFSVGPSVISGKGGASSHTKLPPHEVETVVRQP